MTTYTITIYRYCRKILGLCLLFFAVTSCTYDYFEDENNFRLYIPQVERGEIDNLYIAIYDASGNHLLSRALVAPFDKDDFMKQGILRFKLPYGRNYQIASFANYDENELRQGDSYTNSYFQKLPLEGTTNLYSSQGIDTRAYISSSVVYPIGHPESKIPRVVNLNEKQSVKGKIVIIIEDLPADVEQIDTYYRGLATRYNFNGTFSSVTADDRIFSSIDAVSHTTTTPTRVATYEVLYSSSSGVAFGQMPALEPLKSTRATPEGAPVELDIHLFAAGGRLVGNFSFTDADFQQLKAEGREVPKDASGNPVKHLVLEPQQTITFRFRGFTIIGIGLVNWGDIIDGGTTPF